MTLLQCTGLAFGYGKAFAAPFDFSLDEGQVVALMGRNGSGKSTLLKTLAGIIPLLEGSLEIQGTQIKSLPARELAKRVAYISISKAAPDRMTVRDFVSLGRMPYSGLFDGRNEEDEKIVDDAISLMQLDRYEQKLVSELSDGERTRVYLAEAVAQQAKILLLDEPNAFLDIPWSHSLFRTLRQLAAEKGIGIIVSTHSLEYASRYCDRFLVVANGALNMGSLDEVKKQGGLDWINEIA
ncbi:MAG: ABC transporter ATP-binding protein [Fibrobacter sp.]|nr:ABC transporter ATP-binding protein [Fibrobacter sp.]